MSKTKLQLINHTIMLAFEITPDDVKDAVKEQLQVDIDDLKASRIFDALDLQEVSDKANFSDEGGYAELSGMEAALARAKEEVIRQIKEMNLIN